jgi:ankyrin repeat protein
MKHLLLTTIAAVVLATTAFADPIHNAARNGQLQRAALLIATGAEVNAKDEDGWTPLHYAAWRGKKEVAELLIANGADVNAKDVAGETPLHKAVIDGRKETAELLIAKGADVNAKTKDGWGEWWTVLDWAELVRKIHVPGYKESPKLIAARKEIPDLLRKHGGKTGEELEAADN